MAEPILYSPRVVTSIGQRVATRVSQHEGVDRKGEAGARADALHQAVDGVGRERAAALGCEHESREQRTARA